jgi:hypothetical protein
MTYTAPSLTEVGSVRDLTQGQGIKGDADSFNLFGWTITYGHS